MRLGRVTIGGERRLLCFSTRVMKAFFERFGGVSEAFDAIGHDDVKKQTKACLWVIATMLDAGDRYAKLNGIDNPKPLTEKDLRRFTSPKFTLISTLAIMETVTNGLKRNVEIEDSEPKNHSGALAPEWFIWYGLKIGLSYREALDIPVGELRDLIAVEQIKREGAREKNALSDDEIIPDVR